MAPWVSSLLQEPLDHRQVVPEVVAELPHLPLLLPEALVVDLPQARQPAGLLQPLVVGQDQHGEQQHDGRHQHEGQHHQPLVQGHGVDSGGLIFLKGQQHHGDEGAQGHGRQSQHHLPQPAGEARLLRREPPAQQQPQGPEHHRPGQAGGHVVPAIEVVPLSICK